MLINHRSLPFPLSDGHMINTNCSSGHFRQALCCKMSVELDTFLRSGKKWVNYNDSYISTTIERECAGIPSKAPID